MKVLVTGGTGFLGRHLVPHLERQGMEVTIINTKNCDLRDKFNLLRFKDEKFERRKNKSRAINCVAII